MDEKRRTVFSKLLEIGVPAEKALDAVIGASEVGLSIITGLGATVAGIPGSAIETLRGRGTAEQKEKYPGLKLSEDTILPTVEQRTEDWTYQPKTETGQDYLENVGNFMEPLDDALRGVSGFLPGLAEKVPGDSRLGSSLMNAADQAIYTALNVMSPTKGLGSGAMLGAKSLQAVGKTAGLKNLDLVTPTAQAIEKAPMIKRFNQLENAMGQLITRKQLAGMQPGVIPEAIGRVKPWYKGGRPQQLGVMAKTAVWNMGRKMSDNQDAWLRAHYGITANVYKELDRLGQVMDSARKQAELKGGMNRRFLDENGNKIPHEDAFYARESSGKNKGKTISKDKQDRLLKGLGDDKKFKSVQSVLNDASNQYHAQIAYNVSILEKFKPGDPRIARLQEGGVDRYIFPDHKLTTIQGLKNDPKIIQGLVGKNLDKDLISNHISPKIASDMNLKGTKVHISTKPFFTGSMTHQIGGFNAPPTGLAKRTLAQLLGKTIVLDGKSIKFTSTRHAPYIDRMRTIVKDFARAKNELTKDSLIQAFKDYNAGSSLPKKNLFDIQYLKKNIVDDGEFISISQQVLTNDTLLATMPVRFIVNKMNPSEGYFIMYDQMKQGSGFPLVESGLDIGSDVNRIFIDVQPAEAGHVWKGQVPKVKDKIEPGIVEKELGQRVRQKFDAPPTEEFLRRRRFGRSYTPPLTWTSKRGSTVGLLSQEDENEQTRNFY